MLTFSNFRRRFNKIVNRDKITWAAVGFLGINDRVFSFGTDTKVISTVFETFAGPIIYEIAAAHGYSVEGARQTVYPDFTLTSETGRPPRIAIDIKTTYREMGTRSRLRQFKYTLGSYTSFLRSPGAKKNIKYPYAEYSDHWVIGFLYTRKEGVPAKVYRRDEVTEELCPYEDVEYFIQEKYKIVGESAGSGNTTNMGSFPTHDINDLIEGRGPFAEHGKELCDEYWRHYGKTASSREYNNIEEFLAWQQKNG